MLLNNILILFFKNTSNAIIGLKILKDDFYLDGFDHLIIAGSQRNQNHEYFVIQVTTSSTSN